MFALPEGKSPSWPDRGGGARYAHPASAGATGRASHGLGGTGRRVSCEVRNGLATAHGEVWSYYVSHEGGRQMLVLESGQGDRIRINDTTEVVVLEIHLDHVEIAVDHSTDLSAGS